MIKLLQCLTLYMLCIHSILAGDLYELLGVSSSATSSQIRKVYRKLALQYHPDKHPEESRAKVEKEFVEIAAAFKVLSDPERRAKYDSHGIVDEKEFENFEDREKMKGAELAAEDTPLSWVLLLLIVSMTIIPVLVMGTKKKKSKSVNRQREALLAKKKF